MKVTVDSKKGLKTDLKVIIDKKTINDQMAGRFEELKKTINLKGFRPGKVPVEILKKQFGKAVYGEVLDKVLKETSAKALEDNKIKVAGQPKIDLKSYGEDKDLEYTIHVEAMKDSYKHNISEGFSLDDPVLQNPDGTVTGSSAIGRGGKINVKPGVTGF